MHRKLKCSFSTTHTYSELSHSVYKSYLLALSEVLERGFNFLVEAKNKNRSSKQDAVQQNN